MDLKLGAACYVADQGQNPSMVTGKFATWVIALLPVLAARWCWHQHTDWTVLVHCLSLRMCKVVLALGLAARAHKHRHRERVRTREREREVVEEEGGR